MKNNSLRHKILIIDNYDSFTYNLVHLVEKIINDDVIVYLNDAFELSDIEQFDKVIISPGPGLPKQAGKTLDVIKLFSSTKSVLGVCLGQQAIAVAFGAELRNLNEVYHGVAHPIFIEDLQDEKVNYLFKNLPNKIEVGRYHSWVIDEHSLPNDFIVTARDCNGAIMAIEHKVFDVQAVQFHPESIMTKFGEQMLRNWLML
ncbi:MAG: aminodeoxychorismate/anthranilate synthase component II [Chitinophagaceae bacterium]|nr:aminodeoxychorismate/anthranilate synthase component II [Chitinophagaceae bacterium]